MKRRLVIAVPIIVIIAIALVTYERRNTIARDLANRVLSETELSVANVALDKLGPRRVSFAVLGLETASGIVITMTDLEVPLEFPSVTPEYVSVGRVHISTDESESAQPTALTPRLTTVLEMSERFPATAVSVSELQVDSLPVLRDAVWNLAPELQRLSFGVGTFTVSAELEAGGRRGHQLQLNVATEAQADAATATAYIELNGDEASIRGYIETDGETALAAGRLFAVIPETLKGLSGELVGMLDLALDQDAPGTASVLAAAASEGELEIAAFDRTLRGSISTNSPVELRTAWPVDDWQLRAPRSSWFADIAGIEKLPIKVSNASCESGVSCELDVELGPASISLGAMSVDRLQATLPLAIDYDDTLKLRLVTTPVWRLTGVNLGSTSIGAIIGIGLSEGEAELSAGALRASAARMTANISNVTTQDYQLDALAITASNMLFDADTLTADLRVPENSGRVAWRDYTVRLPAADAELTANKQQIDMTIDAAIGDGTGTLRGSLRHLLADQAGVLTIDGAAVDFGLLPLGSLISGLPEPLQLIAGKLFATGTTNWSVDDDEMRVKTELEIEVSDIAASWRDVGAAGLEARTNAVVTSDGLRFENGAGSAALVDVGTSIRNLRADFEMPTPGQIDVSNLAFEMLGGSLSAAPFTYDLDSGTSDIALQLQSIQLPFMVEMTGLELVSVEGSLSGAVPLRIEGNAVTGGTGTLTNDPPGGIIRMDAGTAATLAGNSGVEYAARALDNFEFEALTSDVEYRPNGDLALSMRLEGVNPTLDPDQPIILNLGIENNVPQLLRSLQALRSIEEILETRLGARE